MTEASTNYIDGFVFPIMSKHLKEYQAIANQVAAIWKEHGALNYCEYVLDDPTLEGTRSFAEAVNVIEEEVVIFGWVVFPSKEVRDNANAQVPNDSRMTDLVAPLFDPARMIFDAQRMVYGGFRPLIQ